jgi:hypothetical protein
MHSLCKEWSVDSFDTITISIAEENRMWAPDLEWKNAVGVPHLIHGNIMCEIPHSSTYALCF